LEFNMMFKLQRHLYNSYYWWFNKFNRWL